MSQRFRLYQSKRPNGSSVTVTLVVPDGAVIAPATKTALLNLVERVLEQSPAIEAPSQNSGGGDMSLIEWIEAQEPGS